MSGVAQQAIDQYAQNTQFYLHVLHNLISVADEMSSLLLKQVKAQTETFQQISDSQSEKNVAAPPPDPTVPLERLGRTIRRTVLLASELSEPIKPRTDPDPAHRTAARKRIIRLVEDTIEREAKNKDEAEHLHTELLDRLDAPDLDDDIASRPVDDIIEEICRDLGIADFAKQNLWKRRTAEEINVLAARAAANSLSNVRPSGDPKVVVAMRRQNDVAMRRQENVAIRHATPDTSAKSTGPP